MYRTYDEAGREVTLQQFPTPAVPTELTGTRLAWYTATYDAVGQLTSVQELDGSRVTYSYDPSGQLSSEIRSGSGAYAITYSYDALGNRLSKTEDGVLTSYSYGAANQLQSEQTGAASTTYLYDENGNVRSEQTGTLITTYTWDEENRLTKVEYADGSVDTYVYFQDGRRWRAQSTVGASTTTTLFIWDGLNLLLEENESLIARVQWTNFPDEAREVLVMRQAGTSGLSSGASFFPGFDLSGNTRLMVGAAGISKWRGLYESFGEERALIGYGGEIAQSTLGAGYGGQVSGLSILQGYGGEVGSTFDAALNHLRFGGMVGYYTDRNGRIYVRARHYDSSTGRWLSPDPIGFGGGDWNLYRYVDNDPVNEVDFDGLQKSRGFRTKTQRLYPTWFYYLPFGLGPAAILQDISKVATGNKLRNGTWWSNSQIFADWVFEKGPSERWYGPKDSATLGMARSQMAANMRKTFSKQGYQSIIEYVDVGTGTFAAAKETFIQDRLKNSIQAQVGGFVWKATRGQGFVTYRIRNVLTINSFFLHAPELIEKFSHGRVRTGWIGRKERANGFRLMGNLTQYFQWTEPLPPGIPPVPKTSKNARQTRGVTPFDRPYPRPPWIPEPSANAGTPGISASRDVWALENGRWVRYPARP